MPNKMCSKPTRSTQWIFRTRTQPTRARAREDGGRFRKMVPKANTQLPGPGNGCDRRTSNRAEIAFGNNVPGQRHHDRTATGVTRPASPLHGEVQKGAPGRRSRAKQARWVFRFAKPIHGATPTGGGETGVAAVNCTPTLEARAPVRATRRQLRYPARVSSQSDHSVHRAIKPPASAAIREVLHATAPANSSDTPRSERSLTNKEPSRMRSPLCRSVVHDGYPARVGFNQAPDHWARGGRELCRQSISTKPRKSGWALRNAAANPALAIPDGHLAQPTTSRAIRPGLREEGIGKVATRCQDKTVVSGDVPHRSVWASCAAAGIDPSLTTIDNATHLHVRHIQQRAIVSTTYDAAATEGQRQASGLRSIARRLKARKPSLRHFIDAPPGSRCERRVGDEPQRRTQDRATVILQRDARVSICFFGFLFFVRETFCSTVIFNAFHHGPPCQNFVHIKQCVSFSPAPDNPYQIRGRFFLGSPEGVRKVYVMCYLTYTFVYVRICPRWTLRSMVANETSISPNRCCVSSPAGAFALAATRRDLGNWRTDTPFLLERPSRSALNSHRRICSSWQRLSEIRTFPTPTTSWCSQLKRSRWLT